MAEEQDAENIFDVDTTISIVREEKPVKLIKQLDQKYEVIKKAEGSINPAVVVSSVRREQSMVTALVIMPTVN